MDTCSPVTKELHPKISGLIKGCVPVIYVYSLVYLLQDCNRKMELLHRFLLPLCFVLCKLFHTGSGDEFPSLLTANASIAIILDREFLDANYDRLLTDVKVIIEKILREDLRNGGMYVTYYSWSNVNLRNDYLAVFSVTNCKETWEVFDKAREESLLHMALTEADCPRLPGKEAIMVGTCPFLSVPFSQPLSICLSSIRSPSLKWAKNSLKSCTTSKPRLFAGNLRLSSTTSPSIETQSVEWPLQRQTSHPMDISPP